MCFFFTSYNNCPACNLHFNNRLNQVPCWNGRISHSHNLPSIHLCPGSNSFLRLFRIKIVPRHGLRCRSYIYDKEPDEVYRNRCCPSCQRHLERIALPYSDGSVELANLGYHVARGSGAGCHVQGIDASRGAQAVAGGGMASRDVMAEASGPLWEDTEGYIM